MREVWAPSLSKRWLFCARGKGRRDSRIEPRAEHKFRRCGVGRAAREREAERSGGEKAREGRRRAGGERQGRAAGGPERECAASALPAPGPRCPSERGLPCASLDAQQHPGLHPLETSSIPPSSCDNEKCPQDVAKCPQGAKLSPVESHRSKRIR